MNPVAKHFQTFNKNKVEQDRKKEEKKCGYFRDSRLTILLEMEEDEATTQSPNNGD